MTMRQQEQLCRQTAATQEERGRGGCSGSPVDRQITCAMRRQPQSAGASLPSSLALMLHQRRWDHPAFALPRPPCAALLLSREFFPPPPLLRLSYPPPVRMASSKRPRLTHDNGFVDLTLGDEDDEPIPAPSVARKKASDRSQANGSSKKSTSSSVPRVSPDAVIQPLSKVSLTMTAEMRESISSVLVDKYKPKAASESAAGKTWLSPANGDIPIFTDAFLEHNKVRETELRKLRRLTTEYDEQNAILSKHIDKMRAAEAKLRTEMQEMTERMSAGEEALLRLKQQLVTCLANCSVPRLHAMPASTCLEEFVDQVQASLASVDEKEEREARERLRLAFTRFLASEETSLPDSKALEAHQ